MLDAKALREKVLEKRESGGGRHTMLAYAFVRGRPYRSCEYKCRYPASPTTIGYHLDSQDYDSIKAWLAVPPTPYFDAQDAFARAKVTIEKAKRRRRREREEAHKAWLASKSAVA